MNVRAAEQAVADIRSACGASAANIVVTLSGGKDASVVLDLALAAFPAPQCVSAVALETDAAPFGPEWRDLFMRTLAHYNAGSGTNAAPQQRVTLSVVRSTTLAAALATYMCERPTLHSVLMGVRDSDRMTALPLAELTDAPYPPLWRVYPVRAWTHAMIWAHVRAHALPYCTLYERGYTSLGANRAESAPNAALAVGAHAETLGDADAATERAGRTRV